MKNKLFSLIAIKSWIIVKNLYRIVKFKKVNLGIMNYHFNVLKAHINFIIQIFLKIFKNQK